MVFFATLILMLCLKLKTVFYLRQAFASLSDMYKYIFLPFIFHSLLNHSQTICNYIKRESAKNDLPEK